MSIIDREFLLKQAPEIMIRRMASPIMVRGVGQGMHNCNEFAQLDLYLQGNPIALIHRDVHIVDGLKAKLLIEMEIIGPERIILDIPQRVAIIRSCKDTRIPITVTTRTSQRVKQAIKTNNDITIPPHSHMMIPVQQPDLPNDRDLLFEPVNHSDGIAVYAHIVDCHLSAVQVRNDSESPITIRRDSPLGTVGEYEVDGCFAAHPDVTLLAGTGDIPTDTPSIRNVLAAAAAASVKEGMNDPTTPETRLENGITIYGDDPTDFETIVNNYPSLWKDDGGVVDVPEHQWMEIPLVENWRKNYNPRQAKVYPLGTKDRQEVDKMFNKLHEQGRMEWTTNATPFTYPCFVVWRTVDGQPKGRVVVDIRAFNKITSPDTYPIPSQDDILNAIAGSKYITTVDCSAFFYQWRVKREHRHRLTVASHRGQETFKVAVMGFRNSPAYVQRIIDNILREYKAFSRAYVDDITIYSMTKQDHIRHLHTVFATLNGMNIKLAPKKSFIGYPSIKLLGQRVDALGLSIAEEKLTAISQLEFPKTLKDLETYLGMTGYLRQYAPYYAQIAEPLQKRKTLLVRTLRKDVEGNARKKEAARTGLAAVTPAELDSFHQLQTIFSRPTILTHHNPKRSLYVDLDASKARDFGAMVYHCKNEQQAKDPPNQTSVEPILFLSKLLNEAESRYWPTELEIAGLVWTIRKIRHLVEASERPTIVYTDHAATLGIVKQSSLNTVSTEKLNLHLIRASEFLQRFRLNVRYKPGKVHFAPDALSRLASRDARRQPDEDEGVLDTLHATAMKTWALTTTIVQLSDVFKKRLTNGYNTDPRWRRILDILQTNKSLDDENATQLPFERDSEGLIYYNDPNHGRRICVPDHDGLIRNVFKLIHDDLGHPGYHKSHERLTQGVYI